MICDLSSDSIGAQVTFMNSVDANEKGEDSTENGDKSYKRKHRGYLDARLANGNTKNTFCLQ